MAELERKPEEPVEGALYRHFKGKLYRVLYLARHSETLEWMVVYQQQYGEHGIWVRPLAMFLEQVPGAQGMVARFARCSR